MKREISFENISSHLPEIYQSGRAFSLIDTHAHIDYLKFKSAEEIISISEKLGVHKTITIGVSPDHQNNLVTLSKGLDSIYFSQGIHPHKAALYDNNIRLNLATNGSDKKCVAVGEIGLDYHYNYAPKDVQIKVFIDQLKLAHELQKPVIIHTREAEEDTIDILSHHKNILTNGVLLHSYTSNEKLAQFGIDNKFYFGFNGILTFKNSHNLREIVHGVPLSQIVLETDAPFLAPAPFRGVENGPFLLPFIANEIAKILGIDFFTVADQTTKNAKSLFKF